jgi:4-hydroxy-2-oxoheptanedioate aldolase
MRANALRTAWDAGVCTLNCWLSSPSPLQAEMIAAQGFDSVLIDAQHGGVDYADMVAMLTAVSAFDTVPLVRVPWNDPAWIMRALDAGAYGVMSPMINTRADAATFVHWCRYPPEGERSFNPLRAQLHARTDAAGYFEAANATVLTIAQIETREALENLEEIMSTPGLDMAYVGPSDLSISHGGKPVVSQSDEQTAAHALQVLEAGRRHGVRVGLHPKSAEDVRLSVERGADLVTAALDLLELTAGTAGRLAEAERCRAEAGRSPQRRRPV